MIFHKDIWWWLEAYKGIQGMWTKEIKFYIVKVMKFMSKTGPSHLLMSIAFNDMFWKPHIGILHLRT